MIPIRPYTAKARVTVESAPRDAWMLNRKCDGEFEHCPVKAGDTVYVVEIPEPYATLCRPKRLWCATHETALYWACGRMSALLRMA